MENVTRAALLALLRCTQDSLEEHPSQNRCADHLAKISSSGHSADPSQPTTLPLDPTDLESRSTVMDTEYR